jgi:nucleotide-binding universal stress UspA family protein
VDTDAPLLICYDGSDAAKAALEAVAELFEGHPTVVACYWQPLASQRGRFGHNLRELVEDADDINRREHELAEAIVEEGVALAQAAGLRADGRAVEIEGPIEEAILAHANELEAAAIVIGSRSRSSLRSLLIGNVANEVVQRSARPVFLTPSPQLALRRRAELSRNGNDVTES